MRYGRTEQEWERLVDVGTKFLVERASMRRTTSYTEFNAALVNRADTEGFDFAVETDRAAIGQLLGRISEEALPETGGLLISALVQYLDTNDAGPGFYALARSKGLPVPRSADERQLFWAGHVAQLHDRYARSPSRQPGRTRPVS